MLDNGKFQSRLSLPSKGRLADDSLAFLNDCGLSVYRPNPRQYQAVIPALPELAVLFQRPADIVASVRDGSVDFGITGLDVVAERDSMDVEESPTSDLLVLHEALGFGGCSLCLAVPEAWTDVRETRELVDKSTELGRPLRVATKYPNQTGRFLDEADIPTTLVPAEGTLETAPAIGYADLISDVVSSGQTLRDNRLRRLADGVILTSQAVLIANRRALETKPSTLQVAQTLLEFIEAHLRAEQNLAIFANIRGDSPQQIAQAIFGQTTIGGLQGPTISPVFTRQGEPGWYAVNVIVPRSRLFQAIGELRAIGGSGVVVMPLTYIFDEEPPRYTALLRTLRSDALVGGLP